MAKGEDKKAVYEVNKSFLYLSPAGGMIIVMIIILIYTAVRCIYGDEEDDEVEDEGLAPYWAAYRDIDRPSLIGLEMHNIEKGYKTYTTQQFNKLKTTE